MLAHPRIADEIAIDLGSHPRGLRLVIRDHVDERGVRQTAPPCDRCHLARGNFDSDDEVGPESGDFTEHPRAARAKDPGGSRLPMNARQPGRKQPRP